MNESLSDFSPADTARIGAADGIGSQTRAAGNGWGQAFAQKQHHRRLVGSQLRERTEQTRIGGMLRLGDGVPGEIAIEGQVSELDERARASESRNACGQGAK